MTRPRIALMLFASLLLSAPVFAAEPDVERRLKALEDRILQLENENKALSERLNATDKRASAMVKPDLAPTIGDAEGNFTFKARGLINADAAMFDERAGGYNFNNGTAFRNVRLGFDGTAFKTFSWRVEAEFAGNAVQVLDAYLAYTGVPSWTFLAGQAKVPFSLESNTSTALLSFIERGIADNTFSTFLAERRMGVMANYAKGPFTWGIAFTGDNESVVRTDTAAYESVGVNTRATYAVIDDAGAHQNLTFGAAAAWRKDLKQVNGAGVVSNAFRLSDRPNIRVDGGNIADTGIIPNVKDVLYLGGEFVGVYENFSLQGEYNRLHASRTLAGLPGIDLDGGHIFGSWFPTGELRVVRNGVVERVRPLHNFSPKDGEWGALELLFRYDWFDFSETPVAARLGNEGHSFTTGVNWHFNPNMRLMFNWVRFTGTNTPLDPVGAKAAGDAFAARAHVDF